MYLHLQTATVNFTRIDKFTWTAAFSKYFPESGGDPTVPESVGWGEIELIGYDWLEAPEQLIAYERSD